MPVADGGTADSTYVPPMMPERAAAFAYTHTHLQRLDGITQANLETTVTHLWEHGYDAPYDLLIAQADLSSWANTTNVTGWVKRADGLIRYGTQTDLANIDDGYLAVIETPLGPVRVRASARIPTTFYFLYKSFGPLDSRNVLRLSPSPNYGLGAVLLAGDHIRHYPMENAILTSEFYIGIQDRVGAVLTRQASGQHVHRPDDCMMKCGQGQPCPLLLTCVNRREGDSSSSLRNEVKTMKNKKLMAVARAGHSRVAGGLRHSAHDRIGATGGDASGQRLLWRLLRRRFPDSNSKRKLRGRVAGLRSSSQCGS